MVIEVTSALSSPAAAKAGAEVDLWTRLITLAADPEASTSELRAARERAERPSPLSSFPGSTHA